MGSPFQQQAYYNPSPAVAGDFASTNPRAVALAGPFGFVSGAAGVTIGQFAWASDEYIDADNAPQIVNSFGSGPVSGFVHREQQALITTYLQDVTMTIPEGFQMSLMTEGDFWVKNAGSTQALISQKAYANLLTGAVSFAATGSPSTASGTASSIAAETFSVTGSINGNVLTVTAVGSGTVYPGATISGTNVASGTQIVAQLSGTPGGVGTYAVSIAEQSVSIEAISGAYGLLTVGGTVTGTVVVGGLVSGTDVAAGTYITAAVSGAGGAGTYVVDNNTVVSSTSMTFTNNVETKWYAMSSGAAGELVKISSWPQG